MEATEIDGTETEAQGLETNLEAVGLEEEASGPQALTPKMLDLMERISEYGFLTMAEIHFVFGNKTWAYGVMNDLREQGLVADFDTRMSPRKGHYLTHKGYRVLGKFQRLKVGLRFKLERYSTFIFRHRLACAKAGITLAKHPNVKEFMPESRLWKRRKKATDKLCDGEFWYKVPEHEQAERVGLEVELTLKNQGKLDESMEQLGRRKDLDQVWWLCGDTTTLKAVRREVERRDYWLAPQRHFFILFDEFLAAKGKAELMEPSGALLSIDPDKPTLLPRLPEPPQPEPEPPSPSMPSVAFAPPSEPEAQAEAPNEPEPAPPGLVERILTRLGAALPRVLRWIWLWLRESWSIDKRYDGSRTLTFYRWPHVCAAAALALSLVAYRHGPAFLKLMEPIVNPPAPPASWHKRHLYDYGITRNEWTLYPLALSSSNGRYRFKLQLANGPYRNRKLCSLSIKDIDGHTLASKAWKETTFGPRYRLASDAAFEFRGPRSMDRFFVDLSACNGEWGVETFLVQFR